MLGLTQLEKDRMYKEWCQGFALKEIATAHRVSVSTVWTAIDCRPRLKIEGEYRTKDLKKIYR